MNKAYAAILVIILFLAGIALGTLIQQYRYPSVGEYASVGLEVVFAENGTELTTFQWGVTQNATPWLFNPLNITNISNVPVTLVLTYDPASLINITSITLFWDYDNHVLYPGDTTTVIIEQTTTSTSPEASGYYFGTLITAVEYEEP